jgi:dihydrofolate synthase/folylpolyglutamate synthase
VALSEIGLTVVLDVAHNPPAMDYLVRKLQSHYPGRKFRMIVGMSADKDLSLCGQSVMKAVEGDAARVHLVQAAHPRAAKLQDILDATGLSNSNYNLSDPSVTTQIQLATEKANKSEEILVVCGSVFLMSETREALGFDEPRDSSYIAEMAGAGVRYAQENFDDEKRS